MQTSKINTGSTIKIFTLLLIACSMLLSSCDPTDEEVFTGAYNSSPEGDTVRDIVGEFSSSNPIDIAYHDGGISGFLDVLESQLAKNGHLDIIGFYSDDIDVLINESWLKPYPGSVSLSSYTQTSIDAVTKDNVLYGIPIYTSANGIVKAIGISERIDSGLESQAINLTEHIASSSNATRISNIANASSALIQNLPDLVVEPDELGSFCETNGMELFITVLNQGRSIAFPVDIRAEINSGYPTLNFKSPTLQPDESITFESVFPYDCLNPGCELFIEVDILGVLEESDEKNNTAADFCQF